jgi:outer membrane protein OmpA-like peptidoglycan-associated protein
VDDSASKWDIFLGYSFLAPNATVYGWNAGPRGTVGAYQSSGVSIMTQKLGSAESVTRYFNRHFGLQIDSGQNDIYNGSTNGSSNSGMYMVQAGGIYRWPGSKVTPWVHVLGGGGELEGPSHQNYSPGWTTTAGGGLDYELNRHWAIRMIEADYEFVDVRYGVAHFSGLINGWQPGGTAQLEGIRLAAGIVYHIGSFAPPTPVTLECSASPASVYAGDPVTLTATAGGLNPKMNVVYSWSGSGVSGNGTTVTVVTAALAPGSYTVKCGVKEGWAGKEGLKPWETADASTGFTVKAFEPPTISCSANPGTIKPGETSTITASGVSPQNRPLTYSYVATAGTVEGNGASATFSSTGAPTGTTGVTCNVSDDKGQTATANTSVTILAPYVAPLESPEVTQLETRLALHSIFFQTDVPRIEHPNGGLLGSQEETLTTLATDFKRYLELRPDAHLTLTGHADVRGSVEYNQALSERRVARTKQFLVEQGVPETKIETLGLGKEDDLTAAQVEDTVKQNPELSATEREKLLHKLPIVVLAKNRRVDVTLSTTGQQSVQRYPFNAADALILLDQRNLTHRKAAAHKK